MFRCLTICVLSCAWPAPAQQRAIDTEKSTLTVRVSKTGLFSGLAHDHEIAAPIAGGFVDTAAARVELHAGTPAMRVMDRDVSEKDRAEIQATMLSGEVLDAGRYPEIVFRSRSAQPTEAGSWNVVGDLTLHGETHTVTVEVHQQDGHFTGAARLKQTDFGIKPVKIAGGAVRVKDELRVEFDIWLKQ